ncbi:hypothetical protein [Arenibacter algicola]|jgi:hypothetical protein|uniref:Uncharacterized protein n=1 Tax=Arenibacter algicola TaxID=616991 RepID=A0A221UVL7_9FLAO|nr:hypothetical protein [Arenibacter algicola]ASO05397.1 hypothetical protein AREALGSMS7_01935 [Arenibacter algicola]
MNSDKHVKLGNWTAFISFLMGTLIFGMYFLSSNSDLLFVGYVFITIAVIFNLIVLMILMLRSSSDPTNRKKLLKTVGMILCNIPIMLIFIWFALIVIGNMRITFTNATQNKLTDIKILGCETEHIPELEPNESITVWVGITGDCSISLEYFENGILKTEIVAGYVTNGMGQKLKHQIDGIDKDIL